MASLEASHERNRSSNISNSSGSNSRGSGSLGLSNAHWQSVAAWRYLQTTDDLMSSIDDQSSLLARLLPGRSSESAWSRSMASTTPSWPPFVCNALWVSNFCRAMHFTRPTRVGSGLVWSGLVCSWRRFLLTQHISRSTDDNNVCVCVCMSASMCVCVESLERLTEGGGRRGEWCLCVPKNAYRPVKITDNV